MVKIIETNLSVDGENNIKDHQARWVLIDDWRDYCKKYQNYSKEIQRKRENINHKETQNSIQKGQFFRFHRKLIH